MAILTVGPTSTFPSIDAAMAVAGTGDIISLETGYGNETASVTVDGLSFDGGPQSTGINLQLATGITAITLLGTAPINVVDGADANAIVGNDGNNIFSVSSGVDVVTAGNGTDRLVVDYSAATAAITGTLVNITDGGIHAVTFTGVEDFSITTGSGNDTITVGDGSNVLNTGGGDDTITAGNGPNIIDGGASNDTITAGSGVNTIQGGAGNDTIVAGDGGNTVSGGDGDDGITTGSGNDVVVAGLGNDTILTGGGADVTSVDGGIDTVDSGSESDRLIVDYSSSITAVYGGVTGGTLAGGYDGAFADVAGTSSVVFQGTENFTLTTGSGDDVIATGDGNDVLDGGSGNDQLNGGGGNDTLLIGRGNDALDGSAGNDAVIFSAARANYRVTDLGGGVIQTVDLRSGSADGTDTLINVEGFVFSDGTFDSTTVLVAPNSLLEVQEVYRNVLRVDPSNARATIDAARLDAGLGLEDYVDELIEEAQISTVPGLIVYSAIMGETPASAHLDGLAVFVNNQVMSPGYQATMDPRIGGFEAMGLGLSGTTEFQAIYGGGTDTNFIVNAYDDAFGRQANVAQIAHFQQQIDYFEALYLGVGQSNDTASLGARGAAVGQMFGIAAAEVGNQHSLAATTFLQDASDSVVIYGAPLLGTGAPVYDGFA